MPKQKPFVAIIDYQLSNMFSVKHVFDHLGIPSVITSDPLVLAQAQAAVLPGVGAFGDAMKNLGDLKLSAAIQSFVVNRPLMGVCLGLQLLFSESDEFGTHEGLHLVKGHVKKLPHKSPEGEPIRVPQIGWNTIVSAQKTWQKTPLAQLPQSSFMYFVHSYYVVPDEPSVELTRTEYQGFEYCSGIYKENIFALQFHPEKSGPKGVEIYRHWYDNYV